MKGLHFATERFVSADESPDGKLVAFIAAGHHPFVGIYSKDKQAYREVGAVFDGDITAVYWSPDNKLLAYQFTPPSGYQRVGIYDYEEETLLQPDTGTANSHLRFKSWFKANGFYAAQIAVTKEGECVTLCCFPPVTLQQGVCEERC